MLNWLRKITLNTQEKYYSSIDDIPLYNWVKCNDDQLQYTRKYVGSGNNSNDALAWEKLYNEYLEKFGLNDRYKKYLDLMRKKALLQAEYLIKKDKFKLTEINITEAKLKDLELYFGDGQKIEVILTWLGMWLGYKLDQRNTTVTEYFVILEEYGKANKKVGNS